MLRWCLKRWLAGQYGNIWRRVGHVWSDSFAFAFAFGEGDCLFEDAHAAATQTKKIPAVTPLGELTDSAKVSSVAVCFRQSGQTMVFKPPGLTMSRINFSFVPAQPFQVWLQGFRSASAMAEPRAIRPSLATISQRRRNAQGVLFTTY